MVKTIAKVRPSKSRTFINLIFSNYGFWLFPDFEWLACRSPPQWRSKYQTSPVFKWSKIFKMGNLKIVLNLVQFLHAIQNGPEFEFKYSIWLFYYWKTKPFHQTEKSIFQMFGIQICGGSTSVDPIFDWSLSQKKIVTNRAKDMPSRSLTMCVMHRVNIFLLERLDKRTKSCHLQNGQYYQP